MVGFIIAVSCVLTYAYIFGSKANANASKEETAEISYTDNIFVNGNIIFGKMDLYLKSSLFAISPDKKEKKLLLKDIDHANMRSAPNCSLDFKKILVIGYDNSF